MKIMGHIAQKNEKSPLADLKVTNQQGVSHTTELWVGFVILENASGAALRSGEALEEFGGDGAELRNRWGGSEGCSCSPTAVPQLML